jgi:hypothetical protein
MFFGNDYRGAKIQDREDSWVRMVNPVSVGYARCLQLHAKSVQAHGLVGAIAIDHAAESPESGHVLESVP